MFSKQHEREVAKSKVFTQSSYSSLTFVFLKKNEHESTKRKKICETQLSLFVSSSHQPKVKPQENAIKKMVLYDVEKTKHNKLLRKREYSCLLYEYKQR